MYENERMQGLCHVFFGDALQDFGRSGAVKMENGNTNVVFEFLTKKFVSASCSSEHEGIRQNSIKTATKIQSNCNGMQNYHGYTPVTHFLDQAEQLFFSKSGVTMKVNEDELESTQTLQLKIMLKSGHK